MNKHIKAFSIEDYQTCIDMEESGCSDNEIISELGLNKNEYIEFRKNFYEDM